MPVHRRRRDQADGRGRETRPCTASQCATATRHARTFELSAAPGRMPRCAWLRNAASAPVEVGDGVDHVLLLSFLKLRINWQCNALLGRAFRFGETPRRMTQV